MLRICPVLSCFTQFSSGEGRDIVFTVSEIRGPVPRSVRYVSVNNESFEAS